MDICYGEKGNFYFNSSDSTFNPQTCQMVHCTSPGPIFPEFPLESLCLNFPSLDDYISYMVIWNTKIGNALTELINQPIIKYRIVVLDLKRTFSLFGFDNTLKP
jgi:hypothetical protein